MITENTIALCQEPNQNQGKITHFEDHVKVVTGFGNKPRACIALHSSLDFILQNKFSNNDMVTITIESKTEKTIAISSIYMPFLSTEPPLPLLMRELITECNKEGWSLIIGSDVNSHNTAWGSTDCNARGEHLLEYILSTDLQICNRGNVPTFFKV